MKPTRETGPTRDWNGVLVAVEGVAHRWLVRHSIDALRITMGLVFLGFGVLKLFPGVSPAQGLVEATIDQMTDGLVPHEVGLVATALLECFIGVTLLAARWLRLTVYLLLGELVGILSPIVLLPGRLFAGPGHMPTLEGQYVLKDIILVAAGMVVATRFRGARITEHDTWVPPAVAEAAQREPAEPATSSGSAGSVRSRELVRSDR